MKKQNTMRNFEVKINNHEELEGFCLMEGSDYNEVIEALESVITKDSPDSHVQVEHDNGVYDFELSSTYEQDGKQIIIYNFDI